MDLNNLPLYIFGLFENEINKIKINLLKKIAKDYNLNEEELIGKYSCSIELITSQTENLKIVKVNNYNNNITDNMKCEARVWNNGKGARCKRCKNKDNLCTLHFNKLQKEGKLKYGYITEKRPKGVFRYKDPKRESLY